MQENWLSLQNIPRSGKDYSFDNQAKWGELFTEFKLPCRITDDLVAQIFVLPQEDGVLFKGTLKGRVVLPCDRCAEDSLITLDESFASFEPYPEEEKISLKPRSPQKEVEEDCFLDVDSAVIRFAPKGNTIEVNPFAYAWEEFSLALPVKPLCKKDCQGICPVCGTDRNKEHCSCKQDSDDPRMEKLRNITLDK